MWLSYLLGHLELTPESYNLMKLLIKLLQMQMLFTNIASTVILVFTISGWVLHSSLLLKKKILEKVLNEIYYKWWYIPINLLDSTIDILPTNLFWISTFIFPLYKFNRGHFFGKNSDYNEAKICTWSLPLFKEFHTVLCVEIPNYF